MLKKLTCFLLSGTVTVSALLTGCSNGIRQNSLKNGGSESQKNNTAISAKPNNIKNDSTCTVNIDGEIDIIGNGAWFEENVLTISEGGEYRLSGNIINGYVYIDTEENVKLIFDGLNIYNNEGAALYCHSAKNLYIELEKNSENFLSDCSEYTFKGKNESAEKNEPNAAIYCKSDLTIGGSGSLKVAGKYNSGIRCNDNLSITGGNITVDAAEHGIRGTDSVTISGGNIDVTAGNDGIKSTNGSGSDKGCIFISGGEITVNSKDNCIKAEGKITAADGGLTLSSTNGKGISANSDLTVDGGKINILKSTEGLESKALLTVNGGEINIEASDDGLNSGGGKDESDSSSDVHDIVINGGYIYINAAGDGIDSNGDLTINGGTIIVNGPVSSGDGALDCGDFENKITVNGGTIIAVGSLRMAALPDSGSAQNCLCTAVEMNEGETLAIRDSDENNILVFTAAKKIQHIVFSSSDIKRGETYSVYVGVAAEGESKGGLYSDKVNVSDIGEAVCGLTVQ